MDRRRFLFAAGVAGAAVGAGLRISPQANALVEPIGAAAYRLIVPEIFAPLPDPPEHTEAIIIGSGFGGAVSAYRLAKAGITTTVLERGSRWPKSDWRATFANDALPDGRGFWHKKTFTNYKTNLLGQAGTPYLFDDFGGVFDYVTYDNMEVWRGAAVGGGSIVYTGVSLQPEERFFNHVFRGTGVSYRQMHQTYYPRARSILNVSPVPDDLYNSAPFHRHRVWDQQLATAGYQPRKPDSIFNWNVIRDEIGGRSRPSAIIGESTLGNANGAKFDLNQNYLKYAEETGKTKIYPGHQVHTIGQDSSGRYVVTVTKLDPTGAVLRQRTLTCDKLFLAAGSIGTSELLVRARATGTLANLNEHVGEGWGGNGDAAAVHGIAATSGTGGVGASPSAGRIIDESGLPLTLEGWYLPGQPVDVNVLVSLVMVLEDTRASFVYRADEDRVDLQWPARGNEIIVEATRPINDRIVDANAGTIGTPPETALDVLAGFTAHPLGGAVLNKATDSYGRVVGHPGLYVMDGAAIPGATGTVNPSLTITALAERNIEQIIRTGS